MAVSPLPAKKEDCSWLRTLILPLLSGLGAAHCWATLHVYFFNTSFHKALAALENTGYFIVPTSPVMQTLTSFKVALLSGLFFTLTFGAGLSILTLVFLIFWDYLFSRHRNATIAGGVLWIALLFLLNFKGFLPVETAYLFWVPAAVGWIYHRQCPSKPPIPNLKELGFLLTPLILLAAIWGSQFRGDIFLSIRDHLLLGNALGQKINNFYYQYTLYPAQAFKRLDNKTLKVVDLSQIPPSSLKSRIEKRLRLYDYLDVPGFANADLKIEAVDQLLLFKKGANTILQVPPEQFFSASRDILTDYAIRTDRRGFFRMGCLLGLLSGLPIIFYLLLFALIQRLILLFSNRRTAGFLAGGICLLGGIVILWPVYQAQNLTVEKGQLQTALASEDWKVRKAAVKMISEEGLEISTYGAYEKILKSRHIPERYWLARALGKSRVKATYPVLLGMLEEEQHNVVCQVFFALGQRRNSAAVEPIREKMTRSHHWYEQWYGYRAMRRIGWIQKKSD